MSTGRIRYGVTRGMRGWFAIIYDDAGPIQSGYGSYDNADGAWQEAYEWAMCGGMTAAAEKIRTEHNL